MRLPQSASEIPLRAAKLFFDILQPSHLFINGNLDLSMRRSANKATINSEKKYRCCRKGEGTDRLSYGVFVQYFMLTHG